MEFLAAGSEKTLAPAHEQGLKCRGLQGIDGRNIQVSAVADFDSNTGNHSVKSLWVIYLIIVRTPCSLVRVSFSIS